MGSEGGLQRPRQPWLRHLGARGELAGSMERERYGLGKVEESAGVLTFEGIGSRWPGGEINDGVCGSVRGAVGEIGRDRELAERRSLTSSVVAELYAALSIYKRWKAVGGGTAASSAAR